MADEFDYHFLMLAPGASAAWFMQAARQFWLRFQPIVTDDWSLIDRVPPGASVAVTVLAQPANLNLARKQIEARRSDIHLDMVVARDLPEMEVLLNRRVRMDQPVGEAGVAEGRDV